MEGTDVLPVRIALRFLKSSRTQTILIMVGLGVGVAVQIFVGMLLQNLQAGFVDSVVGTSSHVTVLPGEEDLYITEWESIVQEMDGIAAIDVVSVSADASALLTEGDETRSIFVRGFVFEDADRIYQIGEGLYDGDMPASDDHVLLGRELVEDLGLELGGTVSLTTAAKETFNLTVSGFFDLGSAALNERWVMINLAASQSIFGMGNRVTSVESQVREVFEADKVATKVAALPSTAGLEVENWIDNNEDLFSALASQSASSYMIQTFVLMSVVIGIASVLSITVLQKSRQIGILKAMGIKDKAASLIFLSEGLFLGVGGAVVGMTMGTVLFLGFLRGISSSGDSIISSDLNYTFIAASGIIAILAALGASLLPAAKSRKLDPIEVIRDG
jgi:lipoprotein-releasing system permease protein